MLVLVFVLIDQYYCNICFCIEFKFTHSVLFYLMLIMISPTYVQVRILLLLYLILVVFICRINLTAMQAIGPPQCLLDTN